MNIDTFVTQIENMLDTESAARLPIVFLRLFQVLQIFSLLSLFPLHQTTASIGIPFLSIVIESLVIIALSILLAEIGIRSARKGHILGFWIGIILSFKSIFCFLGLFGFYAFLNPSSQTLLLNRAPEWLRALLTKLKINYIQ